MSEWEKLYRETEAAYDKLTKSLEECKEENQKLRELVREVLDAKFFMSEAWQEKAKKLTERGE